MSSDIEISGFRGQSNAEIVRVISNVLGKRPRHYKIYGGEWWNWSLWYKNRGVSYQPSDRKEGANKMVIINFPSDETYYREATVIAKLIRAALKARKIYNPQSGKAIEGTFKEY